MLILKLLRIPNYGNKLRSGNQDQPPRRAVGLQDQAVEQQCYEDAAGPVGYCMTEKLGAWYALADGLIKSGLTV